MSFFSRRRRNFFRRTQLERYQTHSYRNPYFRPKPVRGWWMVYACLGSGLGLAIGLVSFFFTSPFFQLNAVRIQKLETIPPSAVQSLVRSYLDQPRWLFFSSSNRFLFEEEDLYDALQKQFSFASLEIIREDQTVFVLVKEKQAHLFLETGEGIYAIDEQGAIIRLLTPEEYDRLLHPPQKIGPVQEGRFLEEPVTWIRLVNTGKEKSFSIGEALFDRETVERLTLLYQSMEERHIPILRVEMNREAGSWMQAVTDLGFRILFDPLIPLEPQISHFDTVWKTIPDPSKLEYIDLRFEDRVYVK